VVQERAEATISLSAVQESPFWLTLGTILRGWALVEQGKGEEAILQMRQGLVAYRAAGVELRWPYYLALLAGAYGTVGKAEEGLNVLTEAFATMDRTGERWYEAELYRLKGELLLQQARQQATGNGQQSGNSSQ
jgi:predicted ATPase